VQLTPDVKAQVDSLTAGGSNLEAILNVHPFHTVRFERAKDLMSECKLSLLKATDFIDGLA
jgi:hypothetical protein